MIICIGIVLTLALLCRFVPGPKCVTYCKVKKKKHKKAVDKMQKYAIIDGTGQLISIDFSGISLKDLIKMYEDTTPFGCQSFELPTPLQLLQDKSVWQMNAREILKETIVERQLLDIK